MLLAAVLAALLPAGPAHARAISGSSSPDRLHGTRGADSIHGREGGDRLSGGAGDDSLLGETGPDHAYGGPGDDVLDGFSGRDLLSGGAGEDVILGLRGRSRSASVGGWTAAGRTGPNVVSLPARVIKRLRAGRYRLVAGVVGETPAKLRFVVTRR